MTKPLLLFRTFLLLGVFVLVNSKGRTQIAGNSSALSVTPASATVVDPSITVGGIVNLTNATVQITQNLYTGDVLSFNSGLATSFGVTGAYTSATGLLSFTGTTSPANWQSIFRSVTYQNTAAACGPSSRSIIFSQGKYLYNSYNGHFYEYISTPLNWKNAKAAAAARTYGGMQGYLATSTSVGENNFIWKLMSADAWIGGSYDYQEVNAATGTTTFANQASAIGHVYWVTGPEKGTLVSSGLGSPVSQGGQYANWAGGEPNNSGNEYYVELYSSNLGKWNDLPIGSVLPYVVEYGGMPGDVPENNSFNRALALTSVVGGEVTGGDVTVCAGNNSTVLTTNAAVSGVTILRWESSLDNFLTAGTVINNTSSTLTVTNLTQTTYFRSVANGNSCSAAPSSSAKITTTGMLIPGTITGNSIGCDGVANTLTLQGYGGIITKWQSSPDNNSWTDISNTTATLSLGLLPEGTYYYRAEIQNASCPATVFTSTFTLTVSSNAPAVVGTITGDDFVCDQYAFGQLTLTGYIGDIIDWEYTYDNGNNWYSYGWGNNPNFQFNYTYPVTKYRAVIETGACWGIQYTPEFTVKYIPVAATNIWIGAANSDFNDANNWSCFTVPVNGANIMIHAGSPNMPILDQNRSFRNLQFGDNTNLNLNGYQLTFTGKVSGPASGTFTGSSASTLTFEGVGAAGSVYFDQTNAGSSNALYSLELNKNQEPVPVAPTVSCTPDASWGNDGTGIENVTLGDINNSTGAINGYFDYTSEHSTSLDASSNYSLSVTTALNYYDNQGIKAWIDWNDNGIFGDDTNEIITDGSGGWAGIYSFNFNTPSVSGSVTSGPKRMRVYVDNMYYMNNYGLNECNGAYGEFEDYTVYLAPTDMQNGGVVLGTNLTLSNSLTLTKGLINTGANLLAINDGATVTGASNESYVNGTIRKIGNSAFTFPVGNSDFYAPISISAPSSATDHFTASYFHTDPIGVYNNTTYVNGIVNISNNEYWILDRTNGSSNVTVTLSWDAARSAAITSMGRLRVTRWNGSQWTDAGNAGLSTGNLTAGTVTSLLVNNFSPFTIGVSSFSLPVTLLNFTAAKQNKAVSLHWQTSSELNNNRFDVERSIDGNTWIKIGTVNSRGNNNTTADYSFTDEDPANGNNYYRLRQVDNDGKFSYSQVRVVYFGLNTQATVYPNPFTSSVTVDAGTKIIGDINIVDMSGKVLLRSKITKTKETINLSHLPAGQYTVIYNNTYFKILKMGR